MYIIPFFSKPKLND